ncbi:BZ3500_MvSof-1268-A1-R1_Chr3-1g05531 [Microbotryum saponariae]|uniref:BZ3500_MvSof-1268-A1-R1_Chr3-1g05531 protein n=1 Tax=Microbotryum saponariae TaxID=289078 RepID=A0A2X0KWN8_9BASI|nr:BZ3500_MvSof-1268-A1-R1_Chr3-1g05531 [Microbotryum saponariae]SDA04722.1 BZ3501_MvSof-1269-A2-R1_Chr3-1g05202 [Microbotryum saponariae]
MTTGAPTSVRDSTTSSPMLQRPLSSRYGPANGATSIAGSSGGQHAGVTALQAGRGTTESRSKSIPMAQLDDPLPSPAHTHQLPTDATILSEAELVGAKHDHKDSATDVRKEDQKHEFEEVERERAGSTSRYINTPDDVEMLRRLAQAERDEYVKRHAEPEVIDRGKKGSVQEQLNKVLKLSRPTFNTLCTTSSCLASKRPRTTSGPDEQHPLDIPKLTNPSHSAQIYHTKIPIYAQVEQAPTIHQTVKHQIRLLSELNSSSPSLASHLPSKTTVCRSADNPAHAPLWRTFLVDGGNLTSNLTHNMESILHSDEQSCECVADGPVPESIQMYHPRRSGHRRPLRRPDDQHKTASI